MLTLSGIGDRQKLGREGALDRRGAILNRAERLGHDDPALPGFLFA